MPNVLVRDLSDDVHAGLLRNAERRHQSLQQYLATELTHLAERRPVSEILDELEMREGGRVGFQQAVKDLAGERARR